MNKAPETRAGLERHRTIIIGGGIVGMLTANELLRSGGDVVVIDCGQPEQRCSFGNAGSVSAGSVAPLGMPGVLRQVPRMLFDKSAPLRVNRGYLLHALPWLTRFVLASSEKRVEEISLALTDLLSGSVELYTRLLKEAGAGELLQRRGQLQLYPSQALKARDAGTWDLRRRRGVAVEDVGGDDIRQLEPDVGARYTCGVYLPNEGMVTNPARLVEIFTEEFFRNGGRFVVGSAVGFEQDTGRARAVVTDVGLFEADAVVVAAGAWSNEISRLAGDDVPLQTQRGYHVTFADAGVALRRPVVAADRKYFVTPMEMGLRVAGTVEFDSLDAPPDLGRAHALGSALLELLPAIDTRNGSTWMGHRPCMPDSLPVIDRSSHLRNVFYAFGNGHLGLTGAPRMAVLVSDLLLGRESSTDLTPFRADRFNRGRSGEYGGRAAAGRRLLEARTRRC